MRILHVLPSLDPATGGPAFAIPALCQAMADGGDDVVLLTTNRNGAPLSGPASRATFPIRAYRPLLPVSCLPGPEFCKALMAALPAFSVAVLHGVWNAVTTFAAYACLQQGVPYLIAPRGMLRTAALGRKRLKKMLYYRFFDARIFKGCAAVLCFNETDAAESKRLLPASVPVLVLPNGVDADTIPPDGTAFRRLFSQLTCKRILLFLGRLHWSKNLLLQVEAFERLAVRFPDLVWVVAGPDAGEGVRLATEVHKKGLSSRVLFTGLLDHQTSLRALAAADVVLLTSYHEGHSMTMNEALAAGARLVMTDSVGFDAAKAAGAAMTVPPRVETVAGAVAAILENPELASRLSRAARNFALRYLAWQPIARRLHEILVSVLDGRSLSQFEVFDPMLLGAAGS